MDPHFELMQDATFYSPCANGLSLCEQYTLCDNNNNKMDMLSSKHNE